MYGLFSSASWIALGEVYLKTSAPMHPRSVWRESRCRRFCSFGRSASSTCNRAFQTSSNRCRISGRNRSSEDPSGANVQAFVTAKFSLPPKEEKSILGSADRPQDCHYCAMCPVGLVPCPRARSLPTSFFASALLPARSVYAPCGGGWLGRAGHWTLWLVVRKRGQKQNEPPTGNSV